MFITSIDHIPDDLIIICRDKATQDKVQEILISHDKVTDADSYCFEPESFFSQHYGINAIRIGPDDDVGHGSFISERFGEGLSDILNCYDDGWFDHPTIYIEGIDFISSLSTSCQNIDQSALFDFLL